MSLATLVQSGFSRRDPKGGVPGVVSLEYSGLNRSRNDLYDRTSQLLYSANVQCEYSPGEPGLHIFQT